MLTGQLVVVQLEVLHGRAATQLRRDVACAAIRSCLVRGTLVYQLSNVSKKVLTAQFVAGQPDLRHASAEAELRRDVACAARRSF